MTKSTFCSLSYALKKKVTCRESFLQEMEMIVPWVDFESLIEPHYLKLAMGVSRWCFVRYCAFLHVQQRERCL